jgi:hypothetical protein
MKKILAIATTVVLVLCSSQASLAWTEKSGTRGFNSRYAQLITYYSPKYGTFEKLSSLSSAKLRSSGYWSLTIECDQKEEELNTYIMRYDRTLSPVFMSATRNDFVDFELDGIPGYLSGYNSTNYRAVFLENYFYGSDFDSPYLFDEIDETEQDLGTDEIIEEDYVDEELDFESTQFGIYYDWERSKKIQFKIYLASGSVEYPKFSLSKLSSQKKKLTSLGCGPYFDRYF